MKENKEKTTNNTKQMVIRSVDIEAISAANMAAKREKKRIGKWVSEVILKAAQDSLTKTTEVAKPEDARDVLKEFVERFERIEKKILEEPWYRGFFRRKDK